MPASRTTPRKARVLQGGANLCLVQDLKSFGIKEPRDPPECCQLARGLSGKTLNVVPEGQRWVISDPQYFHLVLRQNCLTLQGEAQGCARPEDYQQLCLAGGEFTCHLLPHDAM